MKYIEILIKPASGRCNLFCDYCFYCDEMANRKTADYGLMSDETAEKIIEKAAAFAGGGKIHFAFQGGEPTLVGISFYEKFVGHVGKIGIASGQVSYAIQTNGVLIDKKWISFFKKNKFLIGLSLDGTKELNDEYRKDVLENGSFKQIIWAAKLMKKNGLDFNILTVIHHHNVKKINKIYNYYKKMNFQYLQFIPALDPLDESVNGIKFSVSSAEYEQFLKKFFDLWHRDLMDKRFVSIRYFENILAFYLGLEPDSCDMRETCRNQNVIESNGDVFPCDFYALDKYRLGNIHEKSFDELSNSAVLETFIQSGLVKGELCLTCKWRKLCRGGCKRYRTYQSGEMINKYCEAYQDFFEYAHEGFLEIAQMVKNGVVWRV